MKNLFKTVIGAGLVAVLISSCQPDAHKELGDPAQIIASLQGTWKLTKATQVDEDAARKGFPFKELDITSIFPYTEFSLTFNTNGNEPTTFTAVAGNSPKIIKLTSGDWVVDDPQYPQIITLTNGTTTEQITLGAYPVGANELLQLKVERKDSSANDKLLISYTYQFAKQ